MQSKTQLEKPLAKLENRQSIEVLMAISLYSSVSEVANDQRGWV